MQEQLHTFLTLAADSEEWNPMHSSVGQLSNSMNTVVKRKILANFLGHEETANRKQKVGETTKTNYLQEKENFTALKIRRRSPFVLLVKVVWRTA